MSTNSDVIILFGGTSSERLVSVASAQHLATILPGASLWYWSIKGPVYAVTSDELLSHQNAYTNEFLPMSGKVVAQSIEKAILQVGSKVLYLGLHGGDGENGWLQQKLEGLKVLFTGSSAASSNLAMNKSKSKEAVITRGILTAAQYLFTTDQQLALQGLCDFQLSMNEVVVKPACDGSSAGLAFLKSKEDCTSWYEKNKSSKDLWLAEERLHGRELTVGVIMHHGCLTVLPPSEVILERDAHFDYQGKYLGVGNKEVTPAEISTQQAASAQVLSLLAHSALGCFGYTRTDMIMTAKGLYYLETNTLPGMTKASFIPQQLRAAGIALEDFVQGQVTLAKTRYQ
jgi:D-alanine-D-alanine ligase